MNPDNKTFSGPAVALSVLTAALADGTLPAGSVRAALWCGLLNAALLSALLCLAGMMQKHRLLLAGLFLLGALPELFRTLLQAQTVCRQEFRSMAFIGLFPLLLWCGWQIAPASWNAVARVLWWLAALGALLFLPGMLGQMQWTRLVEAEAVLPAAPVRTMLYAEYLLWPLLCPGTRTKQAARLPWLAFAVQAASLLGMRLVFGAVAYPKAELLRVWSTGAVSRVDALLLLIWLACAFYRVCFLCAALRLCAEQLLRAGKAVRQ